MAEKLEQQESELGGGIYADNAKLTDGTPFCGDIELALMVSEINADSRRLNLEAMELWTARNSV